MSWWENNIDSTNVVATFTFFEFDTPNFQFDIKDNKKVASFNWLGTPQQPIIVVPGAPANYVEREFRRLQADHGRLFVDENHYLMSDQPMDSMFFAIKTVAEMEGENIDCQKFHLATDRSNITKLFELLCIKKKPYKGGAQACRINLHRIGHLVVFVRVDETDRKLDPSIRPAYGKDFKRFCTEAEHPLTNGSYREITSLKLGELSVLMRFGAECCEIEEEEEENGQDKEAVVVFESKTLAEDSKLKVMKFGEIKRRHLIDLTTRYERIGFPKFIWFNKYLSGISSVVIGWHKDGILQNVTKHPISEFMARAEKDERNSLHRLHNCIERLVNFMRQQDEGKSFAVVWTEESKDQLKIYEIFQPHVVPFFSESVVNFIRNAS